LLVEKKGVKKSRLEKIATGKSKRKFGKPGEGGAAKIFFRPSNGARNPGVWGSEKKWRDPQ